jgi:hypothetical protein
MDLMLFEDAAALAPPRVVREELGNGAFVPGLFTSPRSEQYMLES